MATNSESTFLQGMPRRNRGGGGLIFGVLLLVSLVAGGLVLTGNIPGLASSDSGAAILTVVVTEGPLEVTVTEDGEIESADPVELKCKVEGGAEILEIVPDGTKIVAKGAKKTGVQVEVGDVLVKLDRSKIDDALDSQQISVEKARTTMIQAEKDLAVAKIGIKEYELGTFVQLLQDLEAEVTIAMENLRGFENQFAHTQKMYRKGFVTKLQLEADEFSVKRSKLELQSSKTKRIVLTQFTRAKQMEELGAKVKTSEAKMVSEKKSLDLEERKLKRLEKQVVNCEIRASAPGMVVYANQRGRYGRGEVQIEEGARVHEQQTLIRLPDFAKMQVKVLVHESKVNQIAVGDRAELLVQGRKLPLFGTVMEIGNQPEQTSWYQAKVKEYPTVVKINSEQEMDLVPGMSAEVMIHVEKRERILRLPVETVIEQDGEFRCWVMREGGPVARVVKVALSSKGDHRVLTDNKFVGIESGVDVGEVVVLNPRDVVPGAAKKREKRTGTDSEKDQGSADAVGSNPGKGDRQQGKKQAKGRGKKRGAGAAGGSQTGLGNLARFDTDKDGKISKQEGSSGFLANAFPAFDVNSDGFITAKEAAAARARYKAQGGGQSKRGARPKSTGSGSQ